MFNKFIKKTSKFFAVVLSTTLAIAPLSYAEPITTFAEFQTALSDGTATIEIVNNFAATEAGSLGTQTAESLEIEGNNYSINGEYEEDGYASGMEMGQDQTTTVQNITFENFHKEGKGSVIDNNKGTLSVINSSFSYNRATGNDSFGGAIRHKSNTETVSLTVTNSSFTANKAKIAGAVMVDGGYTSFTDSLFKDNEAETVGALALFFSNPGEISTLTGVGFEGNKSTSTTNGYAGAIALGSASDARIINGNFTNNQATIDGGAISNRDFLSAGDFSNGKLSITNSIFTENKAGGNGGAIDNYFYKSGEEDNTDVVYINNTKFEGNEAVNGGAIYNHSAEDGDGTAASMMIENSTFTANSASQYGGAIYNAGKMVINNSSFTANTVTGGEAPVANDVYNVGELSFLSGTTTMEGGILGSGTATIDEGAQLILYDNASLNQGSLIIGTGSQLTMDATGLVVSEDITNDGTIEFYGGINNNNIISEDKGNLIISGNTTNKATTIQQSTITVASNKIFTSSANATITTNALLGEGTLQNNGTLLLNLDSAGGFGIKEITSDASSGTQQGETTITVNTTGIELDLTGKTIAQDLVELKGTGTVSLTADPEGEAYDLYTELVNYLQTENGNDGLNLHINVYPSLDNRGVVNIFEDGSAAFIYNSTGTVNFVGGTKYLEQIDTDNEEDISKNIVNIGDAEHATDLTLNFGARISSQTITVSSGSLTMVPGREGGARILTSSMTITADGSLVAWSADAINTVDNEIRSDGQIIFESGTNLNNITGTGTLIIDYDWVVNGLTEEQAAQYDMDSVAPTIAQSTVSINSALMNSSGTIITNYLIGTANSYFENNDKLVLNVNDEKALGIKSLTGVGVSSITVTDDAQDVTTLGIQGATIQQDRLEFYGDKTLRIDGSAFPATRAVLIPPTIQADIYNYMTGDSLHLTYARQEGNFVNEPDSVVYFENDFSVSGQIINNGGTLNIVSNNFVVENGITAAEDYQSDITKNILNIGDTDNAAVVNSSTTISYQTITVSSGSLIMKNIVDNDTFDGSITNSAITVEANGLLSVNPEKLVDISNPIINDGIVEFYGGGDDNNYVSNISTISASDKGILRINGNVQNEEQVGISKQDIQVLQTSTFTVNTNDMTDSKIANAGKLIFFGLSDMTNETEVTGLTDTESGETVYGNLSIDTTLVNNAKIDQNDINVNIYVTNNEEINARGTLTNVLELDNKSAISAATLRNESYTGSIINETGATITATEKLLNFGTISSSGTITAAAITNGEDGVIENYRTNEEGEYEGGTITLTDEDAQIVNKGLIISNANGIKAKVYNEGDGTENSGVYNIVGGTVTYDISGISVNKSTVNIQGDVTIDKESFIGQNNINLEAGNTLKLEDETNLRTSVLNIGEGATLDINNDNTSALSIEGINVERGITWNINFDVNLQDKLTDSLINTNFGEDSTMNIGIINVLADSDYTTATDLQIADSFSNTDIQYASFATTQVSYSVEQLLGTGYDDATWIRIMGKGYGGLPRAVYDSLSLYLVTGDEEGNDKVEKWVQDEHGIHNTLKADLAINALEEGKTLVASPEDPDTLLTGLKTDKYTLKINNEEESKTLTIKGFDNALTVDSTYGRLEINNVEFTENTGDAIITNNGTTTLNGVTFDNTNTAGSDILNNGELVLTKSSSTFTKGIIGDGTTTIKGVGIDMGDAVFAQNRIEISDIEGSSLTVKVANLSTGTVTTSLIMNNGELSLVGGEDEATVAELNTEIKGIGDTTLTNVINVASNISQGNINISENAQITVNDTSIVKASTITINTDATLTANADNIHTTTDGKIANEGSIEFTGGTNKNVIIGEEGLLFISGQVANSTGTKVSQQFIEVKENAKFTMNADDVSTATDVDIKGIQNNGELEITGGTNKNIIGRGDGAVSGNGKLIISGDVVNEDATTIDQGTITVNEGARLQANASDLTTDVGITNAGELVFVGSNMVNTSTITGTGNLTINGDLENDKNITQTNIDILNGTVEHNVGDGDDMARIEAANIVISTSATLIAHSEVVASEKITNNGLFEIAVKYNGEAGDVDNDSVIDGSGELKITSTTFTTTASIKQSTITVSDSDSSLEGDIKNIVATEKIANEGELIYTGEGINNNVIIGAGNLTINGTIENSTGTAISQNAIAITSGNGFKTRADDVTTTDGIENDGTLTFIGGTNTNTITMLEDGEGIFIVENDLTNQAVSITQKEINITGGDFTNVRTSSITAESITLADGSALITDALDLDISEGITLTGEKTVLNLTDEQSAEIAASITGAGKIVKEGEGTVTLGGDNAYTGTTTITGGAIEIVTANGISENTVYMDGGKLIISGDDNIELTNEIMGTDHNDVNIEVTKEATVLTGEIFGNKDLVKTGEGVLDLQMKTNSYAGDTIISSGTIRGTTANINGKVIGSGAADSAVEFYDEDTEVVLNEFDTEKVVGMFEKTGSSTMTVTKDFKALNANILSGTFVINNDNAMGGSGSIFEVTGDMLVENTLLKGYGDISVGKLIIGDGATFAPGSSTTTFKLNGTGDLEIRTGGTYDVEFSQLDMDKANEEQTNDKVVAAGAATIDSNSKLVLNNTLGKYYVPETFELIEASSMNDFEYNQEGSEQSEDKGDYKEITLGNITFKDYDARELRDGYDTRISTRVYVSGGKLMLDLQRNASEYGTTAEFDRSHNEQEAANAIDAISTGNGGDITLPLDVMEHFFYYEDPETGEANIPALKAALNDVAGVIHANSTMLTFTNAKIEHVYDKVKERTLDLFPCTKFHDKIWAQYYYNTYNVDKNANSPKFDTSVNGFLVGFDMISAKQWTMGIMAGYGTSELKQEQDKTTMRDINLGFYGGYENEKWLFKGMLLGGYEQYTTDRTIGFMERMANSEHNGYNAALDLEAGYKIGLNKDKQAKHKMYLKPFLGITGSYIMNEGFEEKGAESLNLKVEDYSSMTAQARAGIGINGKIKKFGWYAKAGVRQYLTEDYNEIEASLLDYQDQTKMKIRSAELDKFSYGGGLGADYQLSEAWTIFANGLAGFANKSNNYYGNIGLMYKFGCPNNEKKTDEDMEKLSEMLNQKNAEDEMLKKQLAEKEKELNAAKAREKELQDRIQKYEANVVSEQKAQKMKEKIIKTFRLGEKPTFVFGTDQLNKNGKASLKQVATELENYPDAEVLVEGHTDNVGGDEINQTISEKRAASVATSLKKDYGVKNNISVIGKGKREPIASNDTAQGRAKNRRVEIILTTLEAEY